MSGAPLPEFANPPVNETVLSLQFAPLERFGIPHFGLYWARIRSNFPKFRVMPPLGPVTEDFNSAPRATRLAIQFMSNPDEVRCWFMDESENRLLQVQRDRFIHNWRQVIGDEPYPRYPVVRSTLEAEWSRFCTFLKSEGFAAPQVNQCEITYVNHIEYGKGWSSYADLGTVIAGWSGAASGDFLPPPERVNMEAHYRLPDNRGRLHISAEPVLRGRDSTEAFQITLTARGAPTSSELSDILGWLDLGREWVVKGFTDFTSSTMHSVWGRQA